MSQKTKHEAFHQPVEYTLPTQMSKFTDQKSDGIMYLVLHAVDSKPNALRRISILEMPEIEPMTS